MKKYMDYFDKYTKHYLDLANDFQKTHIKRKIDHSIRVYDVSVEIARDMKFNSHDLYIISIASLLHDIGRFRQFYEYSTFNDKKSFNHGEVGSSILLEDGVLDDLNYEDKNTILEIVRLHNMKVLPDDLDGRLKLFTTIVRDADKIDYMYAMINIIPKLSIEDQEVFYSNKLDSHVISKELVNSVLNNEVVDKYDLDTIGEIMVCTVYDLLTKYECESIYKIVKREGYIDKVYNLISDSEEKDIIFNYVREQLEKY